MLPLNRVMLIATVLLTPISRAPEPVTPAATANRAYLKIQAQHHGVMHGDSQDPGHNDEFDLGIFMATASSTTSIQSIVVSMDVGAYPLLLAAMKTNDSLKLTVSFDEEKMGKRSAVARLSIPQATISSVSLSVAGERAYLDVTMAVVGAATFDDAHGKALTTPIPAVSGPTPGEYALDPRFKVNSTTVKPTTGTKTPGSESISVQWTATPTSGGVTFGPLLLMVTSGPVGDALVKVATNGASLKGTSLVVNRRDGKSQAAAYMILDLDDATVTGAEQGPPPKSGSKTAPEKYTITVQHVKVNSPHNGSFSQ